MNLSQWERELKPANCKAEWDFLHIDTLPEDNRLVGNQYCHQIQEATHTASSFCLLFAGSNIQQDIS